MKTTNKLIIVIAGLLLGACSSMEEKNTSVITDEELQNEVLFDDETQTLQPNLDEIDGVEAEIEVVELDNQTAIETTVVEAAPMEAMSIEAEPMEVMSIEAEPMEAMSIEAAPMEAMADDKKTTMMDSKLIEVAPLTVIQPAMETLKYGVQVAAYSNRDAVLRGWNALLKKDPVSFGGFEPLVNQKEVKGRTMYQLKVGPFLDKSFSENFCRMLKNKGSDCFITQYSGEVFTAN